MRTKPRDREFAREIGIHRVLVLFNYEGFSREVERESERERERESSLLFQVLRGCALCLAVALFLFDC